MNRFLLPLLLLIVQDLETLRVKVSLVTVGVRVTDSRGRDVRGLKEQDFAVFDDDVRQKIEFFSETEQPITLGIVYTLAFYPQSPDETRYHDLRVTVRGGRYDVRARPGYGGQE